MNTNELTGAALDWAVAKCEGIEVVAMKEGRATFSDPTDDGALNEMPINYSTDWSQGGPIIEQQGIALYLYGDSQWNAHVGGHESIGPTPLIAAMRCYVAFKMGDTVELPEGLKP